MAGRGAIWEECGVQSVAISRSLRASECTMSAVFATTGDPAGLTLCPPLPAALAQSRVQPRRSCRRIRLRSGARGQLYPEDAVVRARLAEQHAAVVLPACGFGFTPFAAAAFARATPASIGRRLVEVVGMGGRGLMAGVAARQSAVRQGAAIIL